MPYQALMEGAGSALMGESPSLEDKVCHAESECRETVGGPLPSVGESLWQILLSMTPRWKHCPRHLPHSARGPAQAVGKPPTRRNC